MAERAASIAQRFIPINMEAQMGNIPDPAVVRPLAKDMREVEELSKVALTRMRLTEDFQGLEYYKMTEAQLARQGMTMELMQQLTSWQVEGMLAFCEDREPPEPPRGVTPELLAGKMGNMGFSSMMSAAGSEITAMPFDMDSETMNSEVVRAEFDKLSDDHKRLIKMGEGYGSFDPAGKEMYIDQIEAVESRWGVFMGRFRLMGELNPEYVRQASKYLQQASLTIGQYRELVRAAHLRMRRDVEQERLAR